MQKILLTTVLLLMISFANGQNRATEIEEIINTPEKPVAPKGGFEKYLKWIRDNNKLKYLSDTLTSNDKVWLELCISKVGQITEINKAKGLGEPYDTEAIRLIKENPMTWNPAEQRRKKVASTLVLPIYFVDERPRKDELKQKER
jgi:hypothetical protein